jgi:hypothetical protein
MASSFNTGGPASTKAAWLMASSFNTGEPASSKAVVSAEAFDRNRQELLAPLAAQPGLAAIWSVLESLATQFKDDPVIRAAVRLQNESSSIDAPLPPRYFLSAVRAT